MRRVYRKHKKNTKDNKAHRKHRHSKGDGYSVKRGMWRAGTLVSALRVAKIRSNLHTGQYASGVPSDHGQRQALVEPLSLPGVTWNHNKFLFETAQEGGSGLAIHTSGFDCNWLKVIIVKKIIGFPAFVGLSISCYTAWYSGTDYVVTFCKCIHNSRVPYKAAASVPGFQGQTIGPSIFRQANGLKDRGETNAGQWSFEDGVYGWMSGEAARILNAGEAVKPQPVNKLPTAALTNKFSKMKVH